MFFFLIIREPHLFFFCRKMCRLCKRVGKIFLFHYFKTVRPLSGPGLSNSTWSKDIRTWIPLGITLKLIKYLETRMSIKRYTMLPIKSSTKNYLPRHSNIRQHESHWLDSVEIELQLKYSKLSWTFFCFQKTIMNFEKCIKLLWIFSWFFKKLPSVNMMCS